MTPARPVVAHLVGSWLPATEGWIADQIGAASGFDPVVLARRREGGAAPDVPAFAVDDLPRARKAMERLARNVTGWFPLHRAAARRAGARLLHAHFGHWGVRALPLARSLGVPLVTSFYGVDMWRAPGGQEALARRYRRLFAEGACFLAEGPVAREQLIRLGCPPQKVRVHRLGVQVAEIPFALRSRTPGEPLRVLMAARFAEKKGFPFGVEACARLMAAGMALRLTIVGGAGPGPAERAIARRVEGIIERYGVGEQVSLVGFVPRSRLREIAMEQHLLLHPSVRVADGDCEGGHPVVLTELAATGMPAIATTHCDIPQVVENGRNGWLVSEGDVEGLEGALRAAFDEGGALASRSREARLLAEERYDITRHTLDGVYAELI
jgi:colanic acid/amylovoran biosynthesis glycosyltransferase